MLNVNRLSQLNSMKRCNSGENMEDASIPDQPEAEDLDDADGLG